VTDISLFTGEVILIPTLSELILLLLKTPNSSKDEIVLVYGRIDSKMA
jgi:hypothetical protein